MSIFKIVCVAGISLCLVLTGCGGGGSGDSSEDIIDSGDGTDTSGDEETDSSGDDTDGSDGNVLYYSIGGTVSGLIGSGLVLQNNTGDDLSIDSDGDFTFSTTLADETVYEISVATQPSFPNGYCNILNGSGTLSGNAITNIEIICTGGRYTIVDTNQSLCYDSSTGVETVCSGVGYDADYSGHQPDYTLSEDGNSVFDHVTGLIWTQSTDLDGSGVIDVDDKLTQPEAASYCSGLTEGGYEWRLPSIKELYSLMDFTGGDPSAYTGSDTSLLTPFIDNTIFAPGFGDTSAGERIIDGQYATTTLYLSPEGTMGGNDTMFGVNFVDGRIKGYPYNFPSNNSKTFYLFCVSGNDNYGINDFVDNSDGTVSDNATGLMWETNDYRSSNFEDAINYCETNATAGWSDWRLPDIKELQSIVDYELAPDYSGSAAIDPLFNATSFTNEGGEEDWGAYWASTTHATSEGMGFSATYLSFGRSLGYFNSEVVDVHGAGAQRSNHKSDITFQADGSANEGFGTFYYHGPQGDILRLDNMVRCVRIP
ncbi:MAG: DUF1566 domain-containing protein [Candidatus Thiodiazotropha sp. 6PLUC2]